MASGWVKSLHCKTRAFDDVYQPYPRSLLTGSSSCRKSAQTLRDVVEIATQKAKKPKPGSDPLIPPAKQPSPALRRSKTEPDRVSRPHREPVYPALTELPEGHPSRNVVEIIFHTGWTGTPEAFPGRVEVIFKVQNGPRAAAHFEEYREAVRSRAARSSLRPGDEDARCAADGNELMRFRCMGPAGSVDHGGSPCGAWAGALPWSGGVKGWRTSICTFSGSGQAHESAGGGRGRRAMMVCRVVAGRVGFNPFVEDRGGYDSVSGENGELVVFDSRAVLPCFLIIYRL